MKYFIQVALLVSVFTSSFALAHANLESTSPEEGSTVTNLEQVSVSFTEDVQVDFSFFKVYKLADESGPKDSKEKLRLNGLAGQLLNDTITKQGDEAERADAGLITTEDTSRTIELAMRPDLEPGVYVLIWRVLSVDTHVTQGFILFKYAP
jgi:copper resistance protein C